MRIAVLGNAGSWYCNDVARAAEDCGHQCQRLDFQKIAAACRVQKTTRRRVPGKRDTACSSDESILLLGSEDDSEPVQLNEFDVVIVRTMPPGTLEQVVFRMDALTRLEAGGTRIVNSPKSIECAVDKYLTTARLLEHGLPVPATTVCQDSDSAMSGFEQLGGDVVVKPVFGAEGRGICRVSDPDLAFRTFRTLERIGALIYQQQFIAHPGFDVRVLVLDGRIVGAMKRFGDGDFRTNVARSARTEIHSPDEAECRLALEAAAAVGAWFAGIDLLYDETGQCFVLEVNAVPGWRAFSRTTGIDVAARLIGELKHSDGWQAVQKT